MPPFGHDTDSFSHVSLRDNQSSHHADEETVNVPRPVYNEQRTDKFSGSRRTNQATASTSESVVDFDHLQNEPQRNQSMTSPEKKIKTILSTEEASQKLPAVQKSSKKTSTLPEKRSALKKSLPEAKKPKLAKTVSFTSVHIREYFVVLGDHPCCSHGPSLSLGWDHTATAIMDLNSFELTHSPRRTRRQLRLEGHVREKMLLDNMLSKEYYYDDDFDLIEDAIDESMGVFFLPRDVYNSVAMTVRE
jgi:hypothetical protein